MSKAKTPETGTAARGRILSAAEWEFAERGFHATTTRDIVRVAGLSTAALYVHFTSKEELLFVLMKEGHQSLIQDMKRAAAAVPEHDVEARLKGIVRAHVIYHARRLKSARVSNQGLSILTLDNRRAILKLRGEIEGMFENVISLGASQKTFIEDRTRVTVFMIMSANIGVSRWYSESGPLTPEDIAEKHADLALRMLRV